MTKYEITKVGKATEDYHLTGKVPSVLCIDKPTSGTQLYEVKYDWTMSNANTLLCDTPKLVKKVLPRNFGIQLSPLVRTKVKIEHKTDTKVMLNESISANNVSSSGIDGSIVHWKKRSLSLFGVYKHPPNDSNNNRATLNKSKSCDAVASCHSFMDQSFQDTTFVKHEISEVSEERSDVWRENSTEMNDTVTGCRSIDSPKQRKTTIQRSKNLADIERAEREEQTNSGNDFPREKRCPACSLPFPSLLKVISHIQKNHLHGVTKVTGSRCVDSLCPVSVRVFNEVPHTLKHLVKSVNRCRFCSFSCRTVGGLTRHTTIHEVSGKRLKEESDSDTEVVIKREREEPDKTDLKKRNRKSVTPEKIEDVGETAYRKIVKPRISISRKPKPKNEPREHLGIRLQKYSPCNFRENSSVDIDSFTMPSKCYVCGLVFRCGDSAATRALHYHTLHRKLLPLRCPFPECPLILRQSALLLEHIRYHMVMQTFSCGLCSFSAPSLKTIKLHARAHEHKRSDSSTASPGDLPAGGYKHPSNNSSTSRQRVSNPQCLSQSAPPIAPRKFVKNPPKALNTTLFSAIWGIEDPSIDPIKLNDSPEESQKRKRKDSSDQSLQKKPRFDETVGSSFGVLSNMKGVTIKVAGTTEVDRSLIKPDGVLEKPKERGVDEILSKLPVTVTIKAPNHRECDLGTDQDKSCATSKTNEKTEGIAISDDSDKSDYGNLDDEVVECGVAPITKLLNSLHDQKLAKSVKEYFRCEVSGKISESESVDSSTADESMDVDEDYVPNEELDTSDEYDMKVDRRSSKRGKKGNHNGTKVGGVEEAGPSCDNGKRPVPTLIYQMPDESKSDDHLFKKPSVSSIKQIRKQTKLLKKDESYHSPPTVTLETAKRRLDFDISDLSYNSFETELRENLKAKSGLSVRCCSEIRETLNKEKNNSEPVEDPSSKSEEAVKDRSGKTRELLKNYSAAAKKKESLKCKTQLKKLVKGGGNKFMKEILEKEDKNQKQRKDDVVSQIEGNYESQDDKSVKEGKSNGVARLRSDPAVSTFMKKLEAYDTEPKNQKLKTRKCGPGSSKKTEKPSLVGVRTPPLARRTVPKSPPPTPDSSCGDSSINSKAVRDAFNTFMSQSKNEGTLLAVESSNRVPLSVKQKKEMFAKFMSVCLSGEE